MKILHIGKYYYPYHGGMESVVQDICEGLAADGHQVEVVCANTEAALNHDEIEDVKVTRVPRYGVLFSQPIIPSLFFLLRAIAGKYDVVHVHSPNPLAEFFSLFLPKEIPLIVTYHSDVVRQKMIFPLYAPILRMFLKRVSKILVATKNHITYSKVLPEFEDKCTIVPFGLSTHHFVESQEVEMKAKKFRDHYGPFALFVGRLVGYKGLDILIKAARQVDHNIIIIGAGPLKDELFDMIRNEGVGDKVHLLGRVDDLEDFTAYYKACEFLVLPSVSPNENFGVVQLEAMFHSKAVITTDLKSGVPCVGVRGKTCMIVEPGNDDQLGKSMSMLFSNPELASKMGREGNVRFKEMYTLETMVKNHEEEYRKTIDMADIIEKMKKAA